MDPRTAKMLAERREAAKSTPPPERRVIGIRNAVGAWLRSHWLLAAIGVTATVAAFSGGRYMLVTRPALEREQLALEETRAAEQLQSDFDTRQAALETCLSDAQAFFVTLWDDACKARRTGKGCSLPRNIVEEQERRRSSARNDCMRRYSLQSP